MRRERLKKTARRLNMGVEEALGHLAAAGHARYRSASDMLSDAAVRDLERAARMRSSNASDRRRGGHQPSLSGPSLSLREADESDTGDSGLNADDFEHDPVLNQALRDYLSAKFPSGGGREKRARPKKEGGASAVEEQLRKSLGEELALKRALSREVERLRRELRRLQEESSARIRTLEEALDRSTAETFEAQARAHAAESRVAALSVDREPMEASSGINGFRHRREPPVPGAIVENAPAESSSAEKKVEAPSAEAGGVFEAPKEAGHVSFVDMLERHGFEGPEEYRQVIEALLADDGIRDPFLAFLRISDPDAFDAFLHRWIVRVCPSCPTPADKRGIAVLESERCDMCGGTGAGRAAETFRLACERHGIERIAIVAPNEQFGRLGRLLSSLDVIWIDTRAHLTKERIRRILNRVQLMVVWRTAPSMKSPVEWWSDPDRKIVDVSAAGIADVLRKAAAMVDDERRVEPKPLF